MSFSHHYTMNRLFLLIFLGIFLEKNRVFTLNINLTTLEENLLYSQLNSSTNLKLFYEKILQSNGIDQSIGIRHPMSNEHVEQESFLNQVRNRLSFH